MTLEELSPLSKRCVEAEARCVRAEAAVAELRSYLERVLVLARGNEYRTAEQQSTLRGARALLAELEAAPTSEPVESRRLARGTGPLSAPVEVSSVEPGAAGELVGPAGLPAGEAGAK